MNEPANVSIESLRQVVVELIPGASLRWLSLPRDEGLQGFFLDPEAASRPLPAEKVQLVMDAPPYWALLWPSGETLCHLLSRCPELVRERTVLDFGCGCGLVAIAAARAGAARVWAVDIDPWALAAAALSAQKNGVEVESTSVVEGAADVLLLADFLYDRTHLPLFESLQAKAAEVLVVDSRLQALEQPGFRYLGEGPGLAVPDLDPYREFGRLRFWYRGDRLELWRQSLEMAAL